MIERPGARSKRERSDTSSPGVSIVTPAFNEASNLPILYERLATVLKSAEVEWEWIIVDDHSSDETFKIAVTLAQRDPRVKAIRLARNSGSHTALICGIQHACGDCAVILAADLQDPPSVVPRLLAEWDAGAQVVWAVRAARAGETRSTLLFARLYYLIMRRFVGFADMPQSGADFFLADRRVLEALGHFREAHVSVLALISWMGFRQSSIAYEKQARLHGRSGWSLEKKLKLVADSVTAFTYRPIRFMSYLGFVVAFAGLLYAAFILVNALTGAPVEGWSSLMIVVLVIGGMQMLMMGVLGEYVWRALDESRGRPRFLIEDEFGFSDEGRPPPDSASALGPKHAAL